MALFIFLLFAGGITAAAVGDAARDEERDKLAKEQAAEKARQEAERKAFEAEWQAEMERAKRAAADLESDAAYYEGRAEDAFDQSVDQLNTAYGEGGTEWAGYEGLVLQNVATRGGYEAQAGGSGLKNTGSVAALGSQLDVAAERNESVTRRAIEGNMRSGIAQTTGALADARFQVGEMRDEAAQTGADWAGFNWDDFVNLPGSDDVSYLQKLYGAKGDVMRADFAMTNLKYSNAMDDLEDDFWNIGADFLSGAKQGLSLASMFGLGGGSGGGGVGPKLSDYKIYDDPSYRYRGW